MRIWYPADSVLFSFRANRPKIYSHQSKLEEAYLAFLRKHIWPVKVYWSRKKVFVFSYTTISRKTINMDIKRVSTSILLCIQEKDISYHFRRLQNNFNVRRLTQIKYIKIYHNENFLKLFAKQINSCVNKGGPSPFAFLSVV